MYVLPAVRFEDGVNLAVLVAEVYDTEPLIAFPEASLTEKVVVVKEALFISLSNTTFMFAFIGTPVASFAGLVELTVGGAELPPDDSGFEFACATDE